MRCEHCGLEGHTGAGCNRPEGVAARGGKVIRIHTNPIGWNRASATSTARGRRNAARARYGIERRATS